MPSCNLPIICFAPVWSPPPNPPLPPKPPLPIKFATSTPCLGGAGQFTLRRPSVIDSLSLKYKLHQDRSSVCPPSCQTYQILVCFLLSHSNIKSPFSLPIKFAISTHINFTNTDCLCVTRPIKLVGVFEHVALRCTGQEDQDQASGRHGELL